MQYIQDIKLTFDGLAGKLRETIFHPPNTSYSRALTIEYVNFPSTAVQARFAPAGCNIEPLKHYVWVTSYMVNIRGTMVRAPLQQQTL